MEKKLHSLLIISFIFLGFTLFNSCTKEYYTIDNSVNGDNWDILYYTIDSNPGTNFHKWRWNNSLKRYECTINISSDDIKTDDFIYTDGFVLPFLFLNNGDGTGETQHLISGGSHIPKEKGVFGCDTSISRNNGDLFTALFYFYWDDPNDTTAPPSYNFRLVLHW